MITLDILVGGHDSEGGNMEIAQEDFVEEFDDPGVRELDLIINELEESVPKSSEEDDTKMFKCSKCGNSFITLSYLSQHKNAVHVKSEKASDIQEEKDIEDDQIFNKDGESKDFAEESLMLDNDHGELPIEPVEHQDASRKKPKTKTVSKHERGKNRKKTQLECPHCGKHFKTLARLSDHEIKKHRV